MPDRAWVIRDRKHQRVVDEAHEDLEAFMDKMGLPRPHKRKKATRKDGDKV